MSTDPKDAKAIFLAAIEKESLGERRQLLDEKCAENTQLRSRVEELLESFEQANSFLAEKPVADVPVTDIRPLTEQPGDTMAPYKLLQQIGEGGMGTVFMAEQSEPIERRVALKIIKPGMDTQQVIARFEAERQALAMMDHPNIAKVLDAGTTETGRPYFVMELVKGVPITDYCDQQHLTPKERLELFIPICHAVQHAHQKGIIHRDLKPSNILVAQYDNKPVPKVIDFGVAKAISHRLTEKTMFTHYGQIVGTVDYMSPEQAQFNQLDVDTRSDIYSLGVLLYELLTGETPFDKARLRSAAFDELLRIIREEAPPRPSTKLSSSESLANTAVNRKMEPKKLSLLVRGELDWIVMKALEKDRGRRYETATAFATDVEHYLNNEAVSACPPSAAYRFRKFARRNKAVIGTTAAIAASLIAGIISTAWQAIEARRERDRADIQRDRALQAEVLAEARLTREREQRQRAEGAEELANQEAQRADAEAEKARTEAAIAQAVNNFLHEDLLGMADAGAQAEAEIASDPDIKLRTVLDRASQRIAGRFPGLPLVEAAVRTTIGRTYNNLGLYDLAKPHLERALELRQSVSGEEHLDTLRCMNVLAVVCKNQGRCDEALTVLQKMLIICRRVLGDEHPKALLTLLNLANVYFEQRRFDDAEHLYLEILEIQQRKLGERHPDTARTMNNLANVYRIQGRHAEAEQLYLKVLDVLRDTVVDTHPEVLNSKFNLAGVYFSQRRYDESQRLHLETLDARGQTLGDSHPDTLQSMRAMANVYLVQGRYTEAERLHLETLNASRQTLGDSHPDTLSSMHDLANAYEMTDDHSRAEQLYLRMTGIYLHKIDSYRETLGIDHPETLASMRKLAHLYSRQGRYNEAATLQEEVLEVQQRILGEDHPDTLFSMNHLAHCLLQQGRYVKAGEILSRTLELLLRRHGPGHPWVPYVLNNLSNVSWRLSTAEDPKQRDVKLALKCAQSVVNLRPNRANDWDNLGVALYRNERSREAAEALEKARRMRDGHDPDHSFFLAMAYWKAGKHQASLQTFARAQLYWDDRKLTSHHPHHEQLRFWAEAETVIPAANLEAFYTKTINAGSETPELVGWYSARALFYERQSRFAAAAADYMRALELVDTKPNVWWGPRAPLAIRIARSKEIYRRVLTLCPDDAGLWVGLARYQGSQGNWQEAGDALSKLIEQRPGDHWCWFATALVKFQLGDIKGYRHACDEMLNRWPRDKYKPIVYRNIIACLLTPDVMADRFDEILAMADDVASKTTGQNRREDFYVAQGLAAYRAGDFDSARRWLEERRGKGGPAHQANVRLLLAMVDHQQGQIAEMDQAYTKALAFIDAKKNRQTSKQLGQQFHSWLICEILRREAEALLEQDRLIQPLTAPRPWTKEVLAAQETTEE
jgi:serine/threonine protein kinase/tetratricopeptide (TPR) repeat protein